MRKKLLTVALFIATAAPSWAVFPPDNSSVISDPRRTNWTKAGVVGGIPNRTTPCTTPLLTTSGLTTTGTMNNGSSNVTLASVIDFTVGLGIYITDAKSYMSNNQLVHVPMRAVITAINGNTLTVSDTAIWSVTSLPVKHNNSAPINRAVSTCNDGVVNIVPGTWNVEGTVIMKSNVTLRGAGADQSYLKFTDNDPCIGSYAAVCFAGGDSNDYFADGKMQPGGSNSATWTGGFSQGATQITLSNVGSSGITAGKYIYLDQADDTSTNNGLFVCENSHASPPCSLEGGAGDPGRVIGGVAHQQIQIVQVTAVNGNTFTINPALYAPNWSASKTPGAWWPAWDIQNTGLEDMTVDTTNIGLTGVEFYNARNVWVKGTRQIRNCDCTRHMIALEQTTHATIQNNYFFGPSGHSQHYGVESFAASDVLVVNNIFQHVPAPMLLHANTGSVYAYNYAINDTYDDGNLPQYHYMANAIAGHSAGVLYNLIEGNIGPGLGSDVFHGNQNLNTVFRNYFVGNDPGRTDARIAVGLEAWCRYYNLVGNVLGAPGLSNSYQGGSPGIYALGGGRANQTNTVPDDPLVATTMLRWGNYDVVTDKNDGAGTGVRWDSSEVPTSISQFPNPIPSTQSLPPSLYLASQPSWWPAGKPWPPIGPDVTGGNISGLAGHAYTLPAEDCYLNVMGGPADGSGNPLNFNSGACYGDSITPPTPTAPSISFQPSNATVIEGNTATFSVGATGYPSPTYQWRKNGSNISGATGSSYTTPATTLADSGEKFSCFVSNSQGNVTSSEAILTVTVAPPAKFKIGDRVVVSNMPVGDSAHIFNAAGGSQVGTQPLGALGTITAGPTDNGGSTWWSVNFDSGVDGWDVENYLELATPPTNNHPGDSDQNMHMTLNEATQYGFCWKSAPIVPGGCPAGADLNRATRAGLLYGSTADGVYHFDSTKTAPACWVPGP